MRPTPQANSPCVRLPSPILLFRLIHRSAWNRNSANFRFWGFSEVRHLGGGPLRVSSGVVRTEESAMAERSRDIWAEWLLRRGTAGDKEGWVNFLRPVRDRVLENAQLSGGETLLDVGSGDGLIAFGALERMGEGGRVILSDVSQDLLDHSRSLVAEQKGVAGRCRYLR